MSSLRWVKWHCDYALTEAPDSSVHLSQVIRAFMSRGILQRALLPLPTSLHGSHSLVSFLYVFPMVSLLFPEYESCTRLQSSRLWIPFIYHGISKTVSFHSGWKCWDRCTLMHQVCSLWLSYGCQIFCIVQHKSMWAKILDRHYWDCFSAVCQWDWSNEETILPNAGMESSCCSEQSFDPYGTLLYVM